MASRRPRLAIIGGALGLGLALLVPVGPGLEAGAQTAGSGAKPTGGSARLQGGLEALAAAPGPAAARGSAGGPLQIERGRVAVDAAAAGDAQVLLADLKRLGLEGGAVFGRLVGGRLPLTSLDAASRLPSLKFMRPVLVGASVGNTTTQGDAAMGTDLLRAVQGVDGTGVTVGTVSTSYNCNLGAPGDIASNDLPPAANINVIDDTNCSATGNVDEGRGMMQIVHDVAPGAAMSFHTGINSMADMAGGIVELATAGADVINDDIFWIANPFFQDGVIAQAVDQVVGMGIPYFAAANNMDRRSYESGFRAGAGANNCSAGTPHDFDPGPGTDVLQGVTIPTGGRVRFSFQWDEPFFSISGAPGSASDIDICLVDAANTVVASGLALNVGNDPFEFVDFTNNTAGTAFNLAITRFAGPNPGRMKWVDYANTVANEQFATNSGTVVGHPNAAGGEAVGAAFYYRTPVFGTNPPIKEGFSSSGGNQILFDSAGNRLNPPITRQKPGIVAPDGVNNTFFNGNDIPDPGDGSDADTFPNFFGTSAAAPHAAAFAALLFDANPALTPAQVYATLRTTAIDMAAPGVDFDTGFGLIQAQGLLAAPCPAPPAPGPGAIVVAGPGLITVGTGGNDVIYGTAGDDRISGGGGNDVIFGQGGIDRVLAGEGDDTVCGGDGGDFLSGDNGADTVSGDAGNDDLNGGAGNDNVFGGLGTDRLNGATGTDVCAGGGEATDQFANCP